MSCRPSAPLIAATELPPCARKHRPAAAALPPLSSRRRRRRRAAAALLPLLCLRCHRAAAANTAHLPLIRAAPDGGKLTDLPPLVLRRDLTAFLTTDAAH
jgi:hypothetical protein